MVQTSGTVAGLLDDGFLLDTGDAKPVHVLSQKSGRELGLRRGDRVHVTGGYEGPGVFASSSAWKEILFGRFRIPVPVNEYESRAWLWWL